MLNLKEIKKAAELIEKVAEKETTLEGLAEQVSLLAQYVAEMARIAIAEKERMYGI